MTKPLGLIIYAAVKPIFKIYFIIGVGFYLAKKNIFTVTTTRDISNAVVSAILPCLIFQNIVTNLKSSDIKDVGILFFTGTVLIFTGGVMAYITSIVTKSPKRWFGGILSVGLFPNISDLPIAYLQTLSNGGLVITAEQGSKGVAYICIFVASQITFQFCFGLYKLIQWDFRELPGDEESIPEEKLEVSEPEDTVSISSSSLSRAGESDLIESGAREPEIAQHDRFLLVREAEARNKGENRSINSEASLHLARSRSTDLRKQKSQDINDVINEYSEFDGMKNLKKFPSGIIDSSAAPVYPEDHGVESLEKKKSNFKKYLIELLKNFTTPNSLALIIAIAVAMAPPLRALFIHGAFHIPDAPDKLPPLSFVMDITSYIGAASVPLGLMLLGATISRLQVKKMPEGFWKTALMITCGRLIILPMIGVGLSTGLYKAGWYDDIIMRFVSVLQFGLPSATSLVYFTAFYTDPNSDDHLQMDCLAVCLIAQYTVLWITLPFLVTFTFKVSIGI